MVQNTQPSIYDVKGSFTKHLTKEDLYDVMGDLTKLFKAPVKPYCDVRADFTKTKRTH